MLKKLRTKQITVNRSLFEIMTIVRNTKFPKENKRGLQSDLKFLTLHRQSPSLYSHLDEDDFKSM